MRKLAIAGAAMVAALCASAPTALAAAPRGVYAVFAQCPIHSEGVEGCIYAPLEGGYLTLGRAVLPITRTVGLQGGFLEATEAGLTPLVAALNGETMTKAQQTIPGGLFGSPLEAVTELAGPASSILMSGGPFGEGLSIAAPIKVRLVNPLLGTECSIGSNAHPVELNLTTGTSGGLTGNPGTKTSIEKGRILVRHGLSMVSGGFMVPKVGGCGSVVVDEAIDAKLGLPTSKNTIATFDMKLEQTGSSLVEEAEDG
jgi:hypothetical protein